MEPRDRIQPKIVVGDNTYVVGPVHGHDLVMNEDGTFTETHSIDGIETERNVLSADDEFCAMIFPQWIRAAAQKP